jgi:glycine cleavage system H protein
MVGVVALLALNVHRDLNFVAKKYEWVTIQKKTLHRSVTNTGVLEALQVSEIKSNVDETVEKKYVQEGQAVKKGQLLVELSRVQTQLEFEQSKNSYLNAEVDYKKVSRELEIQKKLLRNLAVSRSQVEETAQSKEKSKSALDIASRQLAIVREKLDSTMVRSPLSGVVLKDATKVGDKVSPVKAAFDIYAPVAGKISKVNTALSKTPALINQSPYENGWIFLIEKSNPSEESQLMAHQDYQTFLESDTH